MVLGEGSADGLLDESRVLSLCERAFEEAELDGRRVLALVPDHTRTAPVDRMFRAVYSLLAGRVKTLDFMVALGTHPPLSKEAMDRLFGIPPGEGRRLFPKARFFNHAWNDPGQLRSIGTIHEDEVEAISGGLMRRQADVTVNRRVFDYDLLMIIGPVFPHEVAGFSGGNKYLFPGIAGQEIIDLFHWLGALITNPRIIGRKDTPVRRVIDRAADLLPVERLCLGMVVKGQDLAGLYIGPPEASFRAAADLSAEVHVVLKDKPFHRVLSCSPRMYDDLWTGAKCMYKLEPVVADGGELIIHAPHIDKVSAVHGEIIERIGYHVRDYFVKQMDQFRAVPGGVMAHATHVKGLGRFEGGVEEARIEVKLSTGIPEAVCRRINLGYRDPASIDLEAWRNREEEGILFVPRAGEMLYRLKNDPF